MASSLQQIINRRYPRAAAVEFLGDNGGEDDYPSEGSDAGTWHDPNEWTKLITGGLSSFAKVLAARKGGSTYNYSEQQGGVPLTSRFGSGAILPPGAYRDAGGNIITQAGASAGAGVANLGQGLIAFISNNTGLIVIGVVMLMLFKSGRK